MALIKKENKATPHQEERRATARDCNGLIQQLASDSPHERRLAARDLAACPQAVTDLLSHLEQEEELAVQEAIFATLQQIGGEQVSRGMFKLLRTEDASLRNAAVEVLQGMPEEVSSHIIPLLNDRDPDVRIFAIDILQQLAHPMVPQWLVSVLKDETHVNVVAAAVDRLAEVGSPEMVPELTSVKERFAHVPYVVFAVDTAIGRLAGE